jgi:excisionase family DNA binding protein
MAAPFPDVIAETVSLPEAAIHFRKSTQTIRNWVSQGRLDAIRLGKEIRITRESIARLPQKV